MKRVFFLVIALILLFAVPSAMAKETVKIGCIAPLTGDVKTFGESQKNGFFLALEEYGKTGRYQITPIVVDDRNDPTEGANGALKLITQDKAVAFIGPLTSKVSIPVSEIAEKYKVPMVTGAATNPKVTVYDGKRKTYVFRACFIDPFQGSVGANFAANNLKARTAAVLYDVGNDYSKGLAEFFRATFEKGKGTITAYESYQRDDVDFSALITKIAVKKPEVLYIPDYYNKVALIARQVREKGLKATLVGGDGWDSPELVKIGGKAIFGGYFTNHYSPEKPDKVTQDFIRKYKERFGTVPDALAALGYDAAMILLRSLDKAKKPMSEELMKSLSTVSNYNGVTGTMRFDRNGDAIKSVVILRVDKDGAKYVTTINPQ